MKGVKTSFQKDVAYSASFRLFCPDKNLYQPLQMKTLFVNIQRLGYNFSYKPHYYSKLDYDKGEKFELSIQ